MNLAYVTKVDLDELSGQATFERGILKALNRAAQRTPGLKVEAIVARPQPSSWFYDLGCITPRFLPPKKKRSLWYLQSELVIGCNLLRFAAAPGNQKAIFVRYHSSMFFPALVAGCCNIPLVFRSGPIFESLARFRGALRWYENLVSQVSARLFCRVAKRIVVVTEGIGRWFTSFLPATHEKILVIPNAADPDELPTGLADRSAWGLRPNSFVLGFVGSFVVEQGVQTVIRALALLAPEERSRLQVLLVGDGPMKKEWLALAHNLRVNDLIVWAGKRPRDLVASALASADILILPVTNEVMQTRGTSAIKLFEYLACDRHILASRGPDFLFLEKEEVGTLVEPDDPESWAEAIRQMLSRGAVDNRGRGRALILERYNFDRVAERILNSFYPAEVTG